MNKSEESGRYQNGKIYKLWNPVIEDFYIGSTCTTLPKRWHKHKYDAFTRNSDSPVYQKMREVGLEGWRIELIEDYKCNSKNELLRREGEKIRELKPSLNLRIAGRQNGEWAAENSEKVDGYKKKYRETHKDQINTKKNQKRKDNHEAYLLKDKEYRETHKEQIRESNRKYNEKLKEKYTCECGSTITKGARHQHDKGLKHKNFIESKLNPGE